MKVKTIIRGAMLVTLMASTACVPFDTIIIDNGYYDDPFYGPGLPPPPVVNPMPPAPHPNGPDHHPDHRPDNHPDYRPDNRPDDRPDHRPDNRPDDKPNVKPSKPDNKPDVRPSGSGGGKRPGSVNTGGSGKRPSNRRH